MQFHSHFVVLGICSYLLVYPSQAAVSAEEERPTDHHSVPWPTVVPVPQLRLARQRLGSSHNYTTDFPHWANRTLLSIGQKFMAENFYGYVYSVALTTIIAGVDTQRVLISGGNTTDVQKAARRYLINVLHFWYWSTAKLGSEELYESLNLIHAVHAKVGHEASNQFHMFEKPLIPNPPRGSDPYHLNHKAWDAFERDLLASPLRALRGREIFPPRNGKTVYPLNQMAMALQMYSFMAFPVISPDKMLMVGATDEELWAYTHFWAFLGRGLGIEDEYNVCLQPDLESARAYFRGMLTEYFVPGLLDMTYEYKVVIEIFLKAVGAILGFEDVIEALLYRVCRDILEIDCPNVYKTIPSYVRPLNMLLERGAPITQFGGTKMGANFLINSIVQRETLKYFHFNTLLPKQFSDGMLKLGNQILETSNVHWKGVEWEDVSQHL